MYVYLAKSNNEVSLLYVYFPLTIRIHYHNREKSLFIRKYLMLPKHWAIIYACSVIGTYLFLKLKFKNTNIHVNYTNKSQKDPQTFHLLYVWHMVSLWGQRRKTLSPNTNILLSFQHVPVKHGRGQKNTQQPFHLEEFSKEKHSRRKLGAVSVTFQSWNKLYSVLNWKGALLSKATPQTEVWNRYTR